MARQESHEAATPPKVLYFTTEPKSSCSLWQPVWSAPVALGTADILVCKLQSGRFVDLRITPSRALTGKLTKRDTTNGEHDRF